MRVDASRTSASAPDLGRLTVRTPLETCNVWVAGRDLGYPPITDQKLAAGNYRVEVRCPDGNDRAETVTIEAGKLDHEGHPMSTPASAAARSVSWLIACVRAAWRAAPRCRRRPRSSPGVSTRAASSSCSAGKYAEALKDFEAVVDIYPASSVADEALLAIARYQLDVQRNPVAAQATAESLLKKFPASDSVAMSYVVAGQATVAKGLTPGNVDAALASFDRVQRLFAGTEAVAPALVAAGDTLRRLGRCPEALDKFDAVTMAYPRASWAAAARLSSAACLATGGRPLDAMQELQRVILAAPGSPEAQQARTLNTIVYRLYVRPPARSPYGFSGKSIAGAGRQAQGRIGHGVRSRRIAVRHEQNGRARAGPEGRDAPLDRRRGAARALRGSPGACAGGAEGAARAGGRTRSRDADADRPARRRAGEGAR